MLLAVDVGNTTTAAAVFRRQNIIHRGAISTPATWTRRHLSALLPASLAGQVRSAVVSSVVPRLNHGLAEGIGRLCSVRPVFLDHRTPTGIALRIDRPAQLGADRIADCAGALTIFPPPLIVIDSGTATTFDLLDGAGDYRGGCILPGVAIAIKSLAENTARLKRAAFAVPRSPIGANTTDGMRAGVYFGHIGALESLIAIYRKKLGRKARVVATGGLINHFKGKVSGIDAFEPDLIFLGLRSIHERLTSEK